MCPLNKWERFLDSFDSAGGHLIGAFVVTVLGMIAEKLAISYGHEIQVVGVGAMLMVLKGAATSNQKRKERLPDDPAPPNRGQIVP